MSGAVTERTGDAAFGAPKPNTSLLNGFIGERPDVGEADKQSIQ